MTIRITSGVRNWVGKLHAAITTHRVPAPTYQKTPTVEPSRSLAGRVIVEYQYPSGEGMFISDALSPNASSAENLIFMFEDDVTELCKRLPSTALVDRTQLRRDYLHGLSEIQHQVEMETDFDHGQGYGFNSPAVRLTVIIGRTSADLNRYQLALSGHAK